MCVFVIYSNSYNTLIVELVKCNDEFLYSAVSSPQDLSKRFTFYFPVILVPSNTVSTYVGSIQPYAIINARRYTYRYTPVHISTTCCAGVLFVQRLRISSVPRGSCAGVLSMERLYITRVYLLVPFSLKGAT